MKLQLSDLEPNEAARDASIEVAMDWVLTQNIDDIGALELLVVVNMREPSYRKRLYVYNTLTQTVIESHHTTHGQHSCSWFDQAIAKNFSNIPESRMTSLGAMVIGEIYEGKHGKSRRLHGLEARNNNVEARDIVIHSASYVTNSYILQRGMAGCSWGCFAIDPVVWPKLINTLTEGTLLYCYY